jgi:hypothetical protein
MEGKLTKRKYTTDITVVTSNEHDQGPGKFIFQPHLVFNQFSLIVSFHLPLGRLVPMLEQ